MQYYCKTCGRTLDEDQFYQSANPEKFPETNGHFPECKKCLTRHIDNWNPRTYMWILQDADVPYVEDEWNKLLEKYGRDRLKVTGMTILGRYLSKMKLKQFCDYTWADTERIKAKNDKIKSEVMARQGYSGEEIQKAIEKGVMPSAAAMNPELGKDPFLHMDELDPPTPIDNTPEYFTDDLTDEDKKYLTIKWGRTYKPYEWVQLEEYYQNMINAYDIQTPSHIDYLKLICKTSLKCHQLLDLGDVDGFQKMSKTYDMLMKSAKFTAAQNKNENGEYVSAVDELVLLAEREGFIPRFYVSQPNDEVDRTLRDMRGYVDTLIRDEMNLGNLIEGAIKTMSREEAKEEDEDIDDEDIFDDDQLEHIVQDSDFEDHYDFLEQERDADAGILSGLLTEQDGEG